ncbi:LuxE/PaaK family acyltransferase [Massilia sp. GCM10023247]|uniref:LuxE/PaaK family acyltransferase n=1 Tax=Massilia sp. GCM10023247 TaxID=3252643 RepID=UPI003621AAC8
MNPTIQGESPASALDAAPALPFDLAQPFGLTAADKQALLLASLNELTSWHTEHCAPYRHMRERMFGAGPATAREDVPFLPVRLFKTLELASVPKSQVVKTLTSSGTTGQAVSRIYLDRETSMRQTRVLAAIMASFLGKKRLPMLIIDSPDLMKDRSRFNARAAGILGFSVFGRNHHYCLNGELALDAEGLEQFLEQHRGTPVLAFGFTFVIWKELYQQARQAGRRFNFGPGSTLIHGGGWKRLLDQKVDNETFKSGLREQLGIDRVFNYYGMVEQVGSIFMECEHGHLHAPVFADVIIRDPITLAPLPVNQPGVVQVLSALPTSYPGHSLLTEDMGTLHGEDDCACGRPGRHFTVTGRLPQVEMRGCSDTRVMP